jgi:hypothetical protein
MKLVINHCKKTIFPLTEYTRKLGLSTVSMYLYLIKLDVLYIQITIFIYWNGLAYYEYLRCQCAYNEHNRQMLVAKIFKLLVTNYLLLINSVMNETGN